MMWVLSAALASMCTVGQASFTKIASTKEGKAGLMHFNALKVGASLLFFLMISFHNIQVHLPTVLCASGYGFALFFSTFFGHKALMCNSMALTSLVVSYSIIIPFLFGLVFLNETVSFMKILGIILILVSMYLIKYQSENVKIRNRWFIYVGITFVSNGICSVIQKVHQILYPSSYCREFMLCALCITFILFLVTSICRKEEKVTEVKLYAVISGVMMGVGNYLTLVLSSKVDASVLFPIISVFSMFCNIIVSKLYFKDKFSVMQLTGICLGVFSVLLIK